MRAVNVAILGILWLIALTAGTFVGAILAFGAGHLWTAVAVGFLGGIVFAASAVGVALQLIDATEYVDVTPGVSS